ncbi:pyruvate dehydrogenase complex dihydrolipoamide acetyltransferase [Bartonella ancashensis]|uniref:Acetyltransferase component of pyruvate dehydrogenase complex n=1 Tax=Bartonella ancashensis TaxID=1318743 RepID=A0A0M5L179_9HYPH|nr:pyruvate dehydrogenase complex dihydrolipoamide acetyltransferase [Bartonella ancashensis]ALE03936.1 Dihydrolipoamide acetyltransferase component of pyruvate dehydrogenase complex [Bartonella ancashensis]
MPIRITMPALSPTMEEGNLSKWNVKEGDKVHSGDVIAEIETDKATMEVEAIDDGIVAKIVVPAGTQGVKVNALIMILAEEGEDPAQAAKIVEDESRVSTQRSNTEKNEKLISNTQLSQTLLQGDRGNLRVFASPLARKLAAQAGLDLLSISGTGPHGRIIKRDVEKILSGDDLKTTYSPRSSQPMASSISDGQIMKLFRKDEYTVVPHSSMRKTIAKRLVESKQMVPHFYVSVDCELDSLLKLRAELNAVAPMIETQEGVKPAYKLSVNDMVIKAVALSLKNVPDANVSWLEEGMLYHKHCDIAVAVSVPNGLITPIVRCAEEKPLQVISNEMKSLAACARDNKLKPEEYQGGTAAISNMGMYGIQSFSAIINPPHATIFAIGAGERCAIVKDDILAVATVMSVTLSVDHRAVDGALAAELIQTFKRMIENPLLMLI